VLALLVLDGAAVIATYSRFPWDELYHVHHSGIAAGFGRELVALNFPFGLVGIALVGLAWPRLHGVLRLLGVVAIALCAVVYFAVDQANLDAKPLNAVPALGLALAVALVLGVGVPPAPRTLRGDRVRIALAGGRLLRGSARRGRARLLPRRRHVPRLVLRDRSAREPAR